MNDEDSSSDVQAQLDELTRALEALQAELERTPRRRSPFPHPPSMDELRRFTSEVAIPGLVFMLETNVRALKHLQRTLRLAEDAERAREGGSDVSARASRAGATALSRLEDALADVQNALEGQPTDGEASDLLADARRLREEIQDQLEAAAPDEPGRDGTGERTGSDDAESEPGPEVDVEAELNSIKDQMQDDEDEGDDGE